jgi:hypothetical protein
MSAQAAAVNRRRPENAHLRRLWDALHRAGQRFDGPACDRLEYIIKLYKQRPEFLPAEPECDPARGFNPSILGIESQSPGRGHFNNERRESP